MILAQPCFGMGCLQSLSGFLPATPPKKMLCQLICLCRQAKKPSRFRKKGPYSVAVSQRISDSQWSTSSSAFERTWEATEDLMFKFVCVAFVAHNRSTLTDADTPELTLLAKPRKAHLEVS